MHVLIVSDVTVDVRTKWSKADNFQNWTGLHAVSMFGKGTRLIRRSISIFQWKILKSKITRGEKD